MLNRHIAREHNITGKKLPFICQNCGLSFELQSSLNRHCHQKHSAYSQEYTLVNSPIGKTFFQCSQCPNQFSTIASLLRHQRVYCHSIKHFYCDVEGCHFSSIYKSAVVLHKKHKHAQKNAQFKCYYCSYIAQSANDRARHTFKQHISNTK